MDIAQLHDLRSRVLRGEDVPEADLIEAIKALRVGRQAAGTTAGGKKPVKPKIQLSLADLMRPSTEKGPASPVGAPADPPEGSTH